jgi:hypothetical protein
MGCMSISGTLASDRQNTASLKYNDNISLPHTTSSLVRTYWPPLKVLTFIVPDKEMGSCLDPDLPGTSLETEGG